MTSQIIQQACDEINVITQHFDNTRRNLINWQMQVIRGLDNINLMPDVITLAINAIDTSSNASNSNDLSSDLASFIYGSVFMAKAKYETVVNKNKRDAFNLIRNTAEIFINNIQGLLLDVSQGIGNILNTLRNLFFNNDNWIRFIHVIFILKSFKTRKELKISKLKSYEDWLKKIQSSGNLINEDSNNLLPN